MPTPPPQVEAAFTLGTQIEARAQLTGVADRVFLEQGERAWTFLKYRNEAVRCAHFLQRRLGSSDADRPVSSPRCARARGSRSASVSAPARSSPISCATA